MVQGGLTTYCRLMILSALILHSACVHVRGKPYTHCWLSVTVFRRDMHVPPSVLTMRKQLRTLGSTLLPPKAATSPSWRGIWMASWSSRLRWRWSVKPPGPDTWRNKSVTTRTYMQECIKIAVTNLIIHQWVLQCSLHLYVWKIMHYHHIYMHIPNTSTSVDLGHVNLLLHVLDFSKCKLRI